MNSNPSFFPVLSTNVFVFCLFGGMESLTLSIMERGLSVPCENVWNHLCPLRMFGTICALLFCFLRGNVLCSRKS